MWVLMDCVSDSKSSLIMRFFSLEYVDLNHLSYNRLEQWFFVELWTPSRSSKSCVCYFFFFQLSFWKFVNPLKSIHELCPRRIYDDKGTRLEVYRNGKGLSKGSSSRILVFQEQQLDLNGGKISRKLMRERLWFAKIQNIQDKAVEFHKLTFVLMITERIYSEPGHEMIHQSFGHLQQ